MRSKGTLSDMANRLGFRPRAGRHDTLQRQRVLRVERPQIPVIHHQRARAGDGGLGAGDPRQAKRLRRLAAHAPTRPTIA